MTKTYVFGQEKDKQPDKEPIEFLKSLMGRSSGGIVLTSSKLEPRDWDNVVHMSHLEGEGKDVIYAYDHGEENEGVIYVGKWNDGVVE